MFVIDTLEFSRKMERSGMSKKTAETLAEEIKEAQEKSLDNLATKNDLKLEIALLRQEIKNAMFTTIISISAIITVLKVFN